MPWTVRHRDGNVGTLASNQFNPGHAVITNKNAFVNYIVDNDVHPRVASQQLGNLGFETINRNNGAVESSIQLSRGNRLYFVYDEEAEVVEITQIGGHD
mmetsp:Transcript_100479/g.199535  ORF Transcript_100479/g.199535 Transcript_100479/m.199535 type:complete len:99 (+) Transcript_100479:91-387(+)